MKKTLSVLLSIIMIMGTVSCCFGVTAAAADDVIAFRYDALGFTADENGLAANIDFGKNIIRGFDVGVEGYSGYITAGKEGLYPLFETGSAIGTGDRVKVTTEQGNAETVVADYETVVYGDLDGDGYLDVLDAVLVERISTGAYTPTESDFADGGMSYAAFVEAADVNCDGNINALDYSALVDAALGGAEIDQRRVEANWVENVHSEIETQAFTGLEITPDFDIDLCGKLLEADSDYDVTFSENIEIGEAYITVSAKKDSLYSGEKTFTFEIKSIIEIVCREIGTMLEECSMNDCISVSYDAENAAADVIFDGDALLALELNPDRDALTGVYSELMSLFGKIYAERKLTVGGVTVGENGVKNYAGINELKNELRNALRSFENAEENLVKSFDGVIASETVNESFKVNVKFNCSDADVLGSGLAALDGFVAFGTDEAEPELTVIDVNIPESYARELAGEYKDIYGAAEAFGAMDVNTFIGKFAGLETADITAENGSVINMFTDAFGKMNILVTDILAERDISISADGSEYINAYNGNAFNSKNGSTDDVGSFIAALGELADLESVNASAFSDGRGDYCVYVKVGYADSEYVKNYKLNINVFGTLVDELENTACDYTALTVAINNANTVLSGGTAYTSASLAVVNEKLNAANGVPAGLLKGVNCENQKLIDDTAEELNLAVAALINKADYTKLNEAKSAAEVIKTDGKDYTDDTMAVLDNALSDANELSDDLSFEYQQTVDTAAKAINDAIAALKINADYTALNEAKTAAAEKKNDGKVYTTATMSVLDSALTAAEGVPADLTSENQQTIDEAAAAITAAIEGLKEKADYSALETAKADAAAKKIDGNDYTEDSMATLNTALAAAAEISYDLSVECQQTVTNAANAINDAIAALKINADYTALDKAKDDAAAKKSDPKIYTDATLLVLETALNAAAEVPANLTSESQQLIDDAAAAINNAIAALEEKADYMQLDAAKQAAANVNFATYIVYTEESLAAFNTALENANALSTDLSVDYQQVIDDAAAALNDAITSLKIKADYIALNEAKAAAAEIKANGKVYTNATMSVLDAALADADKVPENLTSESQQLIDDAATAVNNAITALKEKANYSVLESAVQLAAGIKTDGNDYFEDTMAVLDSALEAAGKISDDLSVDDQKMIDDAETAILNAIAALKIKADYTELNAAKEAAAVKKADGKVYTTATMSVLDNALAAAAKISAELSADEQQTIDNAAAAINNAITALKIKANYTAFNTAKANADAKKSDGNDYTEETLTALNNAVNAAAEISADLSVDDQQILDDAAKAINDAIAALKIKADYTALNEAKTAAAAKKNDGKVYTTATMSVLDSALSAAEEVPAGLTIESQQTINDAAAAINNAIAALKVKADYSALETAKTTAAAKKADGNNYTASSMAVLDNALAAAAEISADLSVDEQNTINNAAKAINDAIAALKIPADYTKLNEAKAAAQAKKNDGVVYTTESMAALDSALTAAEGVAANLTSESQQLIDDAAAAINNAIAALVEYVDPSEVNNIAVKLANTSKYLYRVGNANAVALSYLFEAKGDVNSADVVLTVTTVEGTAACTYTANTTAWQNGTVKFSGEGVIKLSIKHTKAPATELYLEVVNGKNYTSASGFSASGANAVLLSDITFSSRCYVSNGYTLYGNGFTINGNVHKTYSLFDGMICLNNGTIDNVIINHLVYPEQNLYRDSASQDGSYYNYMMNVIYVEEGGGTIRNSFISAGRSPVFVGGGRVDISNTTLYGGAVANITVTGKSTLCLTDVTTVQVPMLTCDGSGNSIIGLGIVFDENTDGSELILNGKFEQYNWLCADDKQYTSESGYTGSILDAAVNSAFARTVGDTKYTNGGIVYMHDKTPTITDNRTNTDVTYEYKQITVKISIASLTGGSYNIVSGGDPLAEAPEYEASEQMLVAPILKYSASQNVEMSGDSLNIPVAAKVMKYGKELPYEVYYNGQRVTGDSITVTNKGDYTLTYKYSDSMVYGADGVKTGESVDCSTDVTVKVTKAATKTITMTYDKTNAVYYWVKGGSAFDPDWSPAVPLLEGLVIKSEDENGNIVEIFNGAGMGRIPSNLALEITGISGFKSGATATQVSYNGSLYAYGSGSFDNDKTGRNITVKYRYTDEYNKEHTLSVTWNVTTSTTGTEVSESKFKGTAGTQKYFALFEACGGYCATGFAAVTSGTSITLPGATREGYKLTGWYTAETGGTKVGDAGAAYKMSAADVTFYAHWIAPRTLTFDACGGTYSVTTATYYNGDTVTLTKPEYPGYYFMGWCESEDGSGERYTKNFTMPDKDTTLYAIWSETPPAEFTVKFNVNGGPGSVAQMIAKDGEALELPAAPAREGHTFTGWFTDASGGERLGGAGDEVKFTENSELFAQWSLNSYKVTTSTNSDTLTLTANGQSVSSGASVAYGTVLKVELSYGGTGNRTFTVTGAAYYSDEACLNATTSTAEGTYYIKMPANDITLTASSSCFATGTLITLADGSQKKIEDITFGDRILAWDFFTGTYVEKEISLLVFHGDDTYAVANTVYSDGTVLRTIGEHGVFDYDLNKFVYITAANCTDYIGHRFVKYDTDGSYDIVTMTDAYATTEVTGAYSISSAGTSNAIAEGLLTVAPPEDFYNWIEMDGKLHYDVEQFNADVEKYGLYDYEVFSDYVTYEQFVAFNGAYLKIPVEKGLFTFDYIIALINLYSQWMPE